MPASATAICKTITAVQGFGADWVVIRIVRHNRDNISTSGQSRNRGMWAVKVQRGRPN